MHECHQNLFNLQSTVTTFTLKRFSFLIMKLETSKRRITLRIPLFQLKLVTTYMSLFKAVPETKPICPNILYFFFGELQKLHFSRALQTSPRRASVTRNTHAILSARPGPLLFSTGVFHEKLSGLVWTNKPLSVIHFL